MEMVISWDAFVALANTFGMLLIGVALLIGSEALRHLAGWKTDEEVAALRRRLEDVEALRRREGIVERHLGKEPFSITERWAPDARD